MPQFGQVLTSRRRELRFTLFAATTILQFLLILAFSSVPIPTSEAQMLRQQLPDPAHINAIGIFENNVFVGFPMFTPAIGIGWFAYISIGTGLTISAIGTTNNPAAPGWLLWLLESQLPFFWLELMAYAVAIASSTMLFLTLIYDRKHIRHEFVRFLIGIMLFVLLLWDAADAEYYTIAVSVGNPANFLPFIDWISNVTVGMLAVFAYSNVYGPRLKTVHWALLFAMLGLIIIFPLVYVLVVLSFLGYVFWRNPITPKPVQLPPLPAV